MVANSRVNTNASWTVLYIFQLAATKGMRMAIRILPEGDDARQLAAAEELERCAAAGRDVRNPIGDAGLRDRGNRIAAADDRRPLHVGDGARDLDGALCELIEF